MTVVVYKDRVMAADTGLYETEWGQYLGQVQKITRLRDGSLLGQSGDGDARALVLLLDSKGSGATAEELLETGVEGEYLLVEPDGEVYYVDIQQSEHIHYKGHAAINRVKHDYYAVGAGKMIAIGLMRAGKGAKEAVELAVKDSIYVRSPVQVEKLDA